jgi:hypothetical protein
LVASPRPGLPDWSWSANRRDLPQLGEQALGRRLVRRALL